MKMYSLRVVGCVAAVACCLTWADDAKQPSKSKTKWGHSHLGSEYDQGPRTKPWLFAGIGKTHFPITTKHPEVQKWFDQGNTLLHSFWYYEAERSFRWCLKLDPDCAMAYWGLGRCLKYNPKRAKAFLKQANARKHLVTARERDYIELWEAKLAIGDANENRDELVKAFTVRFDKLLLKYPDDVEAKLLYWLDVPSAIDPKVKLYNIPYRFAMDRLLEEVLRVDPNHVGALHYRIHNWDSTEAEVVVDNCRRLQQLAPGSGHLLHMPGHIFEELGLWHEAAIAMDAATRVEKAYMHRRLIMPEQNWDYFHNLSFLCYIQEQLGLVDAAMFGAEQLLRGPRDVAGGHYRALHKVPMLRVLVKYEKWQEILNEEKTLLDWDKNNPIEQFYRHYSRSYALLGTGAVEQGAEEIDKARQLFNRMLQAQKSTKKKDGPMTFSLDQLKSVLGWKVTELEARLSLARGEYKGAIEKYSVAAKKQAEHWQNDPPLDPIFLYNSLGEVYLATGNIEEAVKAFRRTLETVANDGFALSGLVRAYMKSGEKNKAADAYRTLLEVWSDAVRTNRWLVAAAATGVKAAGSPGKQRSYKREVLDKKGPSIWRSQKAPDLTAIDSKRNRVTLKDFAGRNVILIFYLGGECLHCMDQIKEANQRAAVFKTLNTDIVAISKDDAEKIAEYEKSGINVSLLTDPEFANARRFRSFDDFEAIELHSTLLIDSKGRVHWARHGGDPFMDFEYLETEVKRLNRIVPPNGR